MVAMKSGSGIFLFFFIFVFLFQGKAQKTVPDDEFVPPLDGDLYLSGTFGELRSNHFHSGIDIKTGGVSGKKVYAIGDGYISRIKVGLWGYGNVLYITHPNGYVSVYGHLKIFNDSISAFVRKEQYKRKSFEVEIFPEKDRFRVKKGEVIAFSGNSGGSAGPHLHFEIRKASNQHPVNPLLFGFLDVKDITKPRISLLAIYPQDDTTVINDLNDTVIYTVNGWGLNHYLKGDPDIKVHGRVSFGLKAYDLMDGANNKNGIYSEALYIDSVLVFSVEMKELSFYTTRYINSLIDYAYYKKERDRIVKTVLDTNNRLKVYNLVKNNGIFEFSDTLEHDLEYVVKDVRGNTGILRFSVKGFVPDTIIPHEERRYEGDTVFYVRYNKKFEYEQEGMKVILPANALYRSHELNFGVDTVYKDFLSAVYIVGNKYVPVQKWFSFYIKPDSTVADSLKPKLFIASVDEKGSGWYVGGKMENGRLKIRSRSFGKYTVMMDTISPKIIPLNVSNGKNVSGQKNLRFKIRDEMSGIKSYAAFLNGQWILMEYDPKKEIITYNFDKVIRKGENKLKLYVFDNRDNRSVYEATIFY
jgi:hypothetical protein